LLEQKIGTPFQQKWLTKLLGYDFVVEYKKGVENRVADALSRRESWEQDVSLFLLSSPSVTWVQELKNCYSSDTDLKPLWEKWSLHELDTRKYSVIGGLLLYKNRIVLGQSPELKTQVLMFVHRDPLAGNSGYERTLQRAKKDFYWKGMRKDLKSFIRLCPTCQQNKHDNVSPAGLLQPLPIPTRVWSDIAMDFVEGLPLSQGKFVIMVVVDQFSKYAHFTALAHPYTVASVAKLFVSDF
jgi:hypothetical protein